MWLKKKCYLVLSVLVLSLLQTSCASPVIDQPSLDVAACVPLEQELDVQFQAKMDGKIASAVERGFAGGVVVMRDGVVIYNRTAGSASLDEDIPVTGETLFHVASITKYFTAALILKAVEENKFSLTDSVANFLPGTEIAARGVTFADLLSHQSGLGSSYAAESETVREQAIVAIDNAAYDPEKVGQFRYSNDGFDLLGIILERVYGISFENLLQQKIFTPACLKHACHWGLVDVVDPDLVSQPIKEFPPALLERSYGLLSSAGLLITAEDLVTYQMALMNGRILRPATVEQLLASRISVRPSLQATFGAFLSEHPVLGHKLRALGSEDWGDNAIMAHYLDKDIIVAVVTSRGPAQDSGEPQFRNELSNAAEEILAEMELVAQ